MDNTHGNIITCCVSYFLVMADLRGSECLSVEECTLVFEGYYQWERRLVEKAALNDIDIVENIASIMDKHFPSSKETRELKGILKIDVLKLAMCIFGLCVQNFIHW